MWGYVCVEVEWGCGREFLKQKKRKKQKWVSDGVEAALKGTQKRHTNWKTRNSLRPKTLIATHCMCVKKYCMNNSTIPNMTCGVKEEAKPEMNVMKNSVSPRERCELFLLEKCAASWLEIPLFRYHDEFVNFSWDFHTSTEESERNWKSRLTFWKLWGKGEAEKCEHMSWLWCMRIMSGRAKVLRRFSTATLQTLIDIFLFTELFSKLLVMYIAKCRDQM